MEVLLLTLIVATAILAIAEVAARQQFVSFLSARIEAIKAEIVDLTRDNVSGPAPAASSKAVDYVHNLREQLRFLQRVKADTDSLIAIGASSDEETLTGLRRREAETSPFFKRAASEEKGPMSESLRKVRSIPGHVLSVMGLEVDRLSADHLLALAVITCGAIGALIAGIRGEKRLTLRYLSLGFAAGFVTFLAIKGGKHVFLVTSGSDPAFFNPYSSAFAGLLAGLFTERAYQLLSSVIDQFAKRLESAMKG
jgi:hypothetical protein